jgi:hypothetical protein
MRNPKSRTKAKPKRNDRVDKASRKLKQSLFALFTETSDSRSEGYNPMGYKTNKHGDPI